MSSSTPINTMKEAGRNFNYSTWASAIAGGLATHLGATGHPFWAAVNAVVSIKLGLQAVMIIPQIVLAGLAHASEQSK